MLDRAQITQVYQRAVIVAAAMIVGCVMIFAVAYYFIVHGSQPSQLSVDVSLFRFVVIAVSISALMAAAFLKRQVLRPPVGLSANAQNNRVDPASRMLTATIVAFTMCEGAVLFGIVIAFATKNINDLLPPLVTGLIGFNAHFPRYADWERWHREQHIS